jgi:hypothetical protein
MIKFEGVIAQVDVASQRACHGSHGHRILLPSNAARKELIGLLGLPIYVSGCEGRLNVGKITEAEIRGNEIVARGTLDDEVPLTEHAAFAYEIKEVHIEDYSADVWRIASFRFSGMRLLPQSKCAYSLTGFRAAPITFLTSAAD